MTEERMAYAGSLPCGCIVSAVVDNGAHQKDVARFVAKMIRDGETVTRVTSESLRTNPLFLKDCGHSGKQAGLGL